MTLATDIDPSKAPMMSCIPSRRWGKQATVRSRGMVNSLHPRSSSFKHVLRVTTGTSVCALDEW